MKQELRATVEDLRAEKAEALQAAAMEIEELRNSVIELRRELSESAGNATQARMIVVIPSCLCAAR